MITSSSILANAMAPVELFIITVLHSGLESKSKKKLSVVRNTITLQNSNAKSAKVSYPALLR
jgi:hypothetical protein